MAVGQDMGLFHCSIKLYAKPVMSGWIKLKPELHSARLVFHPVAVAVQFLNGPDHGQAQTGSAIGAGTGFIHFIEAGEQLGQGLFGDMRTGVENCEPVFIPCGYNSNPQLFILIDVVQGIVEIVDKTCSVRVMSA